MAPETDIFDTISMMKHCLRETLNETAEIKRIAIEEEVLIAFEKVDKTCVNALRYANRIERQLRQSD